ncbi:hypothetical protein EVAR_47156_1 [Eumeta japonica]|uniref:Uncharacterized protein n=1 Tax=Eumeta variegata TaxID=151549 RepID=A0A4C1XYT5_EUMVA|nr:hypothetical protein EVAR_47156_1 [Eumeta japonica]
MAYQGSSVPRTWLPSQMTGPSNIDGQTKVADFDDQINAYIAYLDGNESEDGAEEDENDDVQAYRDRTDLLRVLEEERKEGEGFDIGLDPTEEDPPLISDPQTEQQSVRHNT